MVMEWMCGQLPVVFMHCRFIFFYLPIRVTGVFPFGKNTHVEAKITAGKYNRGGCFQYLSPALKALIDAGFTVDDKKRISIDEVFFIDMSEWIDVELSLDNRFHSTTST